MMLARSHIVPSGFDRSGHPNAPRPITPAERRWIEALVEQLIDVLDEADGDPDLEPSLGWSRTGATTRFDAMPGLADLEGA